MKKLNLLLITLITFSLSILFTNSFSQSPDFAWAKSADGNSADYGYGISTDASGNSYITGYFHSPSITFGTTTLTNNGWNDIFIAK